MSESECMLGPFDVVEGKVQLKGNVPDLTNFFGLLARIFLFSPAPELNRVGIALLKVLTREKVRRHPGISINACCVITTNSRQHRWTKSREFLGLCLTDLISGHRGEPPIQFPTEIIQEIKIHQLGIEKVEYTVIGVDGSSHKGLEILPGELLTFLNPVQGIQYVDFHRLVYHEKERNLLGWKRKTRTKICWPVEETTDACWEVYGVGRTNLQNLERELAEVVNLHLELILQALRYPVPIAPC